MTPAEIIYHRRVQVLDRAGQTSVTEACRTFGDLADHLLPLGRPRPTLRAGRPAAQGPPTPGDADRHPTRPGRGGAGRGGARPTLGARQSGRPPRRPWGAPVAVGRAEAPAAPPARPPCPAGGRPGPAHRRDHRHPHHRRPRTARLGSATSPPGLVIWSPWTPSMSASSRASARSGSSPPSTPPPAMRSPALVAGTRPPETPPASSTTSPSGWPASAPSSPSADPQRPRVHRPWFTSHLKELVINQHRIPPRSPNHNAVYERFQGTALQEFYRPAFHRQHFARLADLNTQLQGWPQTYNTRRRNHGDFMRGRTPFAVMEAHLS